MKKLAWFRLIVSILVVGMVTVPLFASGSKEATASMDKELTINSYMSDQAPKDAFAAIVSTFEQQNPGIKVTVNTTAHEQFKTLFPSWLASNNAPDVATWFAGYRMQQYADKGLLAPIPESVFPGGSMEKQFPAAFKNASSYNSKIYFMPQSWYWWAVYYNKDVFQKLGLSIPTTWEQFTAVCDKLKAAGIAPIAIGAKDTWTAGGWFDAVDSAVNGGEFHKQLTAGKVSYTDPKVKNAFSYMAQLSSKGYLLPNATSYSWQEAAAVLFKGQAGMYLMGQFIKDVAPADVKDKLDFFKFPTIGGNTQYSVDTPTDGYVVPAKAKHMQAAQEFMAYLATSAVQEAFCKPLGRLAANVDVAVPNADAQKGLDMVKGATFAMQFYDRDSPEEMAAKGMNAIIDIWTNPANMDTILSNLDKERVRIYAEQ